MKKEEIDKRHLE